ncbi:MAG: hypothetical protein FWG40_02615 [Peptococcaceae bacterium]|nr:hypothetical protein [Peptococcaceae bacterium]
MKKSNLFILLILIIVTLIIVNATIFWRSPRLVTGDVKDVREVTIRFGEEEEKEKVLSSLEAKALFEELRDASASAYRHPNHHAGGISQLDRRYTVIVCYKNGNMDVIHSNGDGLNQNRMFRLLKKSWLTGETGFVSSVKIESIISLIEEYLQSESLS